MHAAVIEKLLLYPQDCILRSLSDVEFYDGFGWNLDLLLRCGINPVAGFPFLLHQLAKTGQDEFAVLFGGFAGDGAERIEEYRRRSFYRSASLRQVRFEVLPWSS